MNLLCPNCQRMLTVPDQSAGQLLKCPLCSSTFAAPGLPQTPLAPPPASSAPDPSPGSSAAPSASATDLYTLSPETNSARSEPPPPTGTSHPFRETAPSPSPVTPPAGFGHTFTATLSPQVLPWIAAGAIVLVFVLLFFPWIGMYTVSGPLYTQNGWEAAFNGHSEDPDKLAQTLAPAQITLDKAAPGVNSLLVVYVLFFILAMLLTVAAAAVPFLPPNLPPSVRPFLPWRWKAAVGLMAFTFLFLIFQLFIGFSLEHRMDAEASKGLPADLAASLVRRTGWLTWTVILHLVGVMAGAGTLWLDHRGARPLPRFEFHW